jgi:hypothetical protein
MKKIFTLFLLITFKLFSQDFIVTAMEDVHQDSGDRTIETIVSFPEDITNYNQIIMRIQLNCPIGGCDPWDRKAFISVENFDEWIEIGRYVTPYGISCGWGIDVSDFKSILNGDVKLKSHIDTWVSPGWLVNIDFDFHLGNPEFEFSQVRNTWNRGQVVYGDPTQPVELNNFSEYIYSDVESVKLKITTTGHGQGNTDNAAEFSNKTHEILINEENVINHNFWRNDCAQNECSPQNGSWTYPRAGFCPGDVSPPIEFDLTPFVSPGSTINLQYTLEEYTNYCSPNYSGCINGQNGCSSCEYNNSSHTEPFYFIASQLVQYSRNYHSNADVFLEIREMDQFNQTISIYMENSIPIYGVQFEINTDNLNPVEPPFNYEMIFGNPVGGRAEEAGWEIQSNEFGTIIGLSFLGDFIPAGEGILTIISWDIEDQNPMEGSLTLEVEGISGYFGESLKFETGEPLEISVLDNSERLNIPLQYKLFDAYPNPFNPESTINFELPQATNLNISIFNINGEKVDNLFYGIKSKGLHSIVWNAENITSGIYIVKLNSVNFSDSKKIILLK